MSRSGIALEKHFPRNACPLGSGGFMRKSGSKFLGKLAWGTHCCQFYKAKQDLIDIMVPYFKAGLENNELCVWVTSDFLTGNDAQKALKKSIPGFSRYLKNGQLEIIPGAKWRLKKGKFDARQTVAQWIVKYERGIRAGFEGMRVGSGPLWPDQKNLAAYESGINDIIANYKLLVLCARPLENCDPEEIIAAAGDHKFAIIKKSNRWATIKNRVCQNFKNGNGKNSFRGQSLFNAMTESFSLRELIFDADGKVKDYRFLEINPAFEKFIGLPRSAVVGKMRSEIPVNPNPESLDIYARTALTGKPAHYESFNKDLNKHFSVYVYHPAKNQFATIFTDITKSKLVENALRTANNRLKLAQRSAGAGIWDWDITNGKVEWSPELYRLFNVDPSKTQASLDAWKNILHRDDVKIVVNSVNSALKNHLPLACEYRITLPGGKTRWINSLGDTIYEKNGKPKQMSGICFDITERKRTEQEMEQSEKKYRGLFENIGEILAAYEIVRDKNKNIIERRLTDGNPAMAREANVRSIKDIRGKTLGEIFGPDYAGQSLKFVKKIMSSGKTGTYESHDPKTGKSYITTITPINENSYMAAAKDITQLKKTEENLNRLNRTLKALNGINHAILRAKDQKEFLMDVCRIIVNDCGQKMVWIGFANDDEEKTVKPVSWAGFESGYLNTLNLTWADKERGHGPTGTAIRTGKIQQCKNMRTDPDFAPWREESLKRGYSSSISMPLIAGTKTLGAITIYSKDTDPFTAEEIKLLAQLADDTAYGIYTINLRDEHARTAEKLRETSEYLENLLAYTSAPIIVWDPSFKIVKFNRAFEKMTGLTAGEVIGKPLKILFPEENKNKLLEFMKSALLGKHWEIVEMPIRRGDGDIRRILWNLANIKGGTGNIVATIAQGRDITDQKLAEEQQQLTQIELKKHTDQLEKAVRDLENLHLAVENASDIIFIADSKGTILSVNKAAETLLGYEAGDMIGKNISMFGSPIDPNFYRRMWRGIKKGNRIFSGEVANMNKDGRKMVFDLKTSPVISNSGKILFFIGIMRDRTEAKEIDRAKTEFISLAAHQLRTPLATMTMAAEMILNGNIGKIDEYAKEQLKNIYDSAYQMSGLIELFLNLSRIELGRLEINPEPMKIADIANDLVKEIRPQAIAKNIFFETDFSENLPVVNIDRRIMHIALENILSNAVKYTSPGGKIAFKMQTENNKIISSVTDTGCGIPKSQMPLIFTKMFRAANVGDVKGMGLGLNITKNTIEQSGGKVLFQNTENEGSTFSIIIPLSGMKKRSISMES